MADYGVKERQLGFPLSGEVLSLPVASGITDEGSRYYKDADGTVFCTLFVSGSMTHLAQLATLPIGFRPKNGFFDLAKLLPSNVCRAVQVAKSGDIILHADTGATYTQVVATFSFKADN